MGRFISQIPLLFSHDSLARQRVNIHTPGLQNLEAVVPIEDGAIGTCLGVNPSVRAKEISRISVEIRLNWSGFEAMGELSGCRGTRGGFDTELYSARSSANFRVAVRPW